MTKAKPAGKATDAQRKAARARLKKAEAMRSIALADCDAAAARLRATSIEYVRAEQALEELG